MLRPLARIGSIGMSSLAGTLDIVAPHIPAALVAPSALGRVRSLCAALPAALTNRLYLECRGASDAPRTDVIVSVNAQGRSLVSSDHPAALGLHLRHAPAWQHVRALARAWSDARNPLHDAIRRLWLEFDLNPHGAWDTAIDSPGAFVDFASAVYRSPSREAQLAVYADALEALGRSTASSLDALHRCIAALPRDARLMYLGVFPGRHAATVRACVSGLADHEIASYLDAVGWTGSRDALGEMLRPLAAHRDARGNAITLLHLDLGDGVAPQVGLERALDRESQLRGRLADAGLMEALVAARLCSVEKRRALDSWPGADARVMPHELWPAIVVRRLNHIKIVGGGDAPPFAKVYLCATHRYFDRRAAAARHHTALSGPAREAMRHSIQ